MKKPQIPVAILVRVSTAKQETARQISELRQYADGKGYEVLEVCEEKISGSVQEDQRHGLRRTCLSIGTHNQSKYFCQTASATLPLG